MAKRTPSSTPSSSAPRTPRRYESSRRALQAAQTRRDVLDAAIALFAESGWAGTTLAAIAERAGVAVETVYSGFGTKKGLLRAAIDVAIVGDDAPIPLREREIWQRMGEGSRDMRMRTGVAMMAEIHGRTAGPWRALVEASGTDPEIAAWRDEVEAARRSDTQASLERIFETKIDDDTLDVLWVLYGPEAYSNLLRERGWDLARYERVMVEVGSKLILPS
jgi:AcrR family transcriptional regulator